MAKASASSQGWLGPIRAWIAAQPLARLSYAALLIVLLGSAPFGGWRSTASDAVAQAAPGEVLSTGQLEITVERAIWSTRPALTFSANKRGVYVLVLGTARVVGDQTVGFQGIADSMRLLGVEDLYRTPNGTEKQTSPADQVAPELWYRDDATRLGALGPGMTYGVAFVFERRGAGSTLGDTLPVTVYRDTYRRHSINGDMEWLDPTPAYRLVLPLEERPPVSEDAP